VRPSRIASSVASRMMAPGRCDWIRASFVCPLARAFCSARSRAVISGTTVMVSVGTSTAIFSGFGGVASGNAGSIDQV
jgi:hypothetical protein